MDAQNPLMSPHALFENIFDEHHLYMCSYERKLFIFALTNLLFGPDTNALWAGPGGGVPAMGMGLGGQ